MLSEANLKSEGLQELARLDKLVHEPARLAILTSLAHCREADFLTLQNITGLTKGNLSAHLSKLEAGDLVAIHKEFVDRKPRTIARLTPQGRQAIGDYWRKLRALQEALAPKEPPATSLSTRSGQDHAAPSTTKPNEQQPGKQDKRRGRQDWRAW